MQTKKIGLIFFCILILFPLIINAQNNKIEITMTEKTIKAGEDVLFGIILYNSQNNIIYDNVKIIIQDAEETKTIEKIINSKDIASISLGEKAKQGQWKITATYKDIQTTETFFVEAKEELTFNIEEGILTIKNNGNIKINKEIQIIIGETTGEPKNLGLNIDEEEKYRLIAPEGIYEIKIISKEEVLFSKRNIQLENQGFTGQAIGAVNEKQTQKNLLTGGISPDKESDEAFLYYIKNSKMVYTFIFVIFGAMILLAIERRYTKKFQK